MLNRIKWADLIKKKSSADGIKFFLVIYLKKN